MRPNYPRYLEVHVEGAYSVFEVLDRMGVDIGRVTYRKTATSEQGLSHSTSCM